MNRIPTTSTPRRGLVGIVGAVAAAVLFAFVPSQEGEVLKTYRDIGGVLTYCDGATENAQWGKTYTPAECKAQLDKDLARHAEGISKCVDMAKLTDGQKVAFTDHAYNNGVQAFCSSSMARKANQGDVAGSCAALDLWVCITVAKGNGDKQGPCASKDINKQFVRGLANRRAAERAICEGRKAV